MDNQKKKYHKPEISVIEMVQENSLLCESGLLCESSEEKVGTTWNESEPEEE